MQTKRSDEITNLAAALAVAQGQIKTAAEDAKVTGKINYSYATLDAIWEVARKPLSDNGLSIVQIPTNDAETFCLETILLHASGEWISGTMTLPVNAGRMSELQAMGSAITYARRYMLGAMVGITTGDDDDGQKAAMVERSREPEPKQKPHLSLDAVFEKIGKVERIKAFYDNPKDMLRCRPKSAPLPAPDDLDGWRIFYQDARDFALDQIDQAVEEAEENGQALIDAGIVDSNGPDMTRDDLAEEYPEIFPPEETE